MKKLLLLTTAFAFSITLMAQNETRKQADAKKQAAKDQKTTPATEVKPQTAQAQPVLQTGPSPDELIKVNTTDHSFGKIKQGVPVTYFFELKNIGDKPVVVENTYSTCGCTTPDKIVDPILPGATAKLKVVFNAGAVGPINKEIHIKLAGIAQDKVVKITGEVLAPEPVQEQKSNN